MILHAKISSSFDENGLIEYEVLTGATFTETYNEELDSGSIVITHIKERIPIRPYDWVRVYDDDGNFAKTYLVDNYVERQINILEPYYEYTIELMSETKILEKIQLPNRQWQHSFNADGTETRKKIREIIESVMKSYVPRVKIADETQQYGYRYGYLIDFGGLSDQNSAIYKRLDHDARDISLSQPTLRQCLTALMTQVGCIPTIKDGELGYLDLRADPTPMTLSADSFSQVQRSASSDSFVNTLISQGENILDADNATVNETIGFRDRNKVFLKQLENLYLETRYPIYKVTKLDINAWTSTKLRIEMKPTGDLDDFIIDDVGYAYKYDEGVWKPRARFYNTGSGYFEVSERKLIFGTLDSEGIFHITSTKTKGSTLTIDPIPSAQDEWWDYPEASDPNIAMIYVAKVQIRPGQHEKHLFWRFSFGATYDPAAGRYWWTTGEFTLLFRTDITTLCVEQTKRQLLDTDFLTMTDSNITDMESLSKYYYGTVGYQIGGKTIEGWSNTYTYTMANSWWEIIGSGANQRTKTYIENITNRLLGSIKDSDYMNTAILNETFFGFDVLTNDNWEYDSISVLGYDPEEDEPMNYANWFFDIEYQPLNSLSVRYSKEEKEIPIPFEQLDSPADSISSMDYLAAHETDSVNRLGNPVVSINQYADDAHWSQVRFFGGAPLRYQDSTIFQITYSFDFNGTAVNYFGSKDFVIKNYNTAIITKYRAYQYMDYSQAITRKENDKVWVLISKKNYPDMDEKVTFGTLYSEELASQSESGLASPFMDAEGHPLTVGYQATQFGENAAAYKNEMSVLTYKNSIILNQEDFDNASAGLRILIDSEYDQIGGGKPQGWYMWPEALHDVRTVGWMTDIGSSYGITPINPDPSEVSDFMGVVANMPAIYGADGFTTLPFSKDDGVPSAQIISLKNKRYDKDYGEVLNQTLQFEYYSDDGSIKFGEFFADSISWKPQNGWRRGIIADADFLDDHWDMSDEEYEYVGTVGDIIDHPYNLISVTGRSLTIDWDRFDYIGVGKCRGVLFKAEDGKVRIRDCYEIAGGQGEETFHIILNDTKTQKAFVIDEETGIPYLSHEIDEL